MTQPFADALTWMPKSRALGATLTRAYDLTRGLGHAEISLEHVLQALIEDPDASALLMGCNVDLLKLNGDVDALLKARPSAGGAEPQIAPGLTIILEYAAAAARQSKRTDVNGAIVLAAMVGEGKSEAARLLTASGLKFQDAIAALRRGAQSRPAVTEAPAAVPPPPPVPAPMADARPAEASAATAGSLRTIDERAMADRPAEAPAVLPVAASSVAEAPLPVAPKITVQSPAPAYADEDPVTAARRRVAALRSSPTPAHLAPPPPPLPGASTGAERTDTWAPAPDASAAAPATATRPARMPPPVPPMPTRPPAMSAGGASGSAARSEARAVDTARAPWADGSVPEAASDVVVPFPSPPAAAPLGTAIDVAELGEALPYRMKRGVASTVEVLIPRSAVLATVTALGSGARDLSVTRALTVRLKPLDAGLHVDVAAPETQWFDTRGGQRADDEARWRWIVTPRGTGTRQLQLSVSIRTVASDGTILETTLPEHQATLRVVSNLREDMRGLGRALLAVSAGAMLALLANGGFAKIFGHLLN